MNSNRLGRVTMWILALFFVTYTGFQTFRFFFTSYKTESAYSFEVARVYATSGLLIREEQAIERAVDGALRYTLPEGGKFIGATPVAKQYSSESAADLADRSLVLEQQRKLLTTAQQKAKLEIKPDIVALNNSIYETLREHTVATNRGEVGDTERFRLLLMEDICNIQAAVDPNISFAGRVAELDREIAAAEQGQELSVPMTGYFSRFTDGFEDDFTPELLDTMTLAQLDELMGGEYPYQTTAFGKCITDYNWYYVTKIPIREAELFRPDTRMTLTFLGSEDNPVSGWVKSVTEDAATGEALLVIQSNDISEDAVSRRTATVQLGFEDYRGIRFSKKALRIQDGVKGVYVRGKSSIQFKKVEVVYTGMDFYLSKLDYNSDVYLNIFDEIIVEGTNLYDGKTLE